MYLPARKGKFDQVMTALRTMPRWTASVDKVQSDGLLCVRDMTELLASDLLKNVPTKMPTEGSGTVPINLQNMTPEDQRKYHKYCNSTTGVGFVSYVFVIRCITIVEP